MSKRKLGESWGRKGVREDCMKEFKELGRILSKRRLGESWRRKGAREDFMKAFIELGMTV